MSRTLLPSRTSEFLGVILFAVSLIWLIALATYDPSDSTWFFNTGTQIPPVNFIGRVGAFLAELSYQILGYASYLIPMILMVMGWNFFWCRSIDALYTKIIGISLLFIGVVSLLSLSFETLDISGKEFPAGGYAGEWFSSQLAEFLNRIGSIIFTLTALFLAVILSTQLSLGRLFTILFRYLRNSYSYLFNRIPNWLKRRKRRRREQAARRHLEKNSSHHVSKDKFLKNSNPTSDHSDESNGQLEVQAEVKPIVSKTRTISVTSTEVPAKNKQTITLPPSTSKSSTGPRKEDFSLPPLTLLDAAKGVQKINERELIESARLLEEKCREFSVEGAVSQIRPGPVVTTYELKPDTGVKYSKITGLADDLCLAMQAESVLIERIPGKSTVGIQIPNTIREHISLRELLESETYQKSDSKLTLALGKTIHGEPFVSDLATMPHLLIAGSTGTGKSVAMNAMLTSILYSSTPNDVKLILIDPKRLELGAYENIPHLLTPVVVDPKQAANALSWAVREMEQRYKTLAAHGVRNIDQFNRNVRMMTEPKTNNLETDSESVEIPQPLPYIVVAIDELADLMMIASNDVEESITRLAQMARAVGIHLILATQRPSVDVITGLIKANFPARISFRVSSKIDSRTILDGNGAEQLLGKGDLLYLPPASSRFIRLHGAYISEQESARLASFLRKQGKPGYDETITANNKSVNSIEFEKDDLYEDAARIVVSSGQASISYLQRRLRIGFSRAARLVDMMEADGLVSPGSSGKPREVLVKSDYFEELDARLK